MALRVKVRKELHIKAPDPHIAVYAHNPTYVSPRGVALIEAAKEEARTPAGRYYDRRIYRRRSEDNGRTSADEPPLSVKTDEDIERGGECRTVPMHFLDPDNGLLLAVHTVHERAGTDTGFDSAGDLSSRTQRLRHEVSRDEGRTWEDLGLIVMSGDEYDETHWGPGLWYGRNGAHADMPPWVKLPDGTVVWGLSLQPVDERGELYSPYGGYFLEVAAMRGRWREDLSGLAWEMGETIRVGPEESSVGCCEPAMAHLGGERLFVTMRCQGDEGKGFPSLKFTSLSEDGGLTWSRPVPLRYDDGELVHSPASLAEFVRPSWSDRLYWIANVSPEPVYFQTPRYPLYIGEVDQDRLCLIRESLRVIDDWREGLPRDVRFTNWGSYEDRETGEIVLTLPEEPKVSWEDLTSDCYRYRIEVEE